MKRFFTTSLEGKCLKAAINTGFIRDMKSLGYKYCGIDDISTKAIPNWYEVNLKNKNLKQTLSISYSSAGKKTKEVLSCHISDDGAVLDEFDYTSTNRMTIECLDISELDGNLEERLSQVIQSISASLKSDYLDVINGSRFETENIDWQGLK